MALDQVEVMLMAIWKERAQTVTGKSLNGGHNLQEDSAAEVLAELTAFLPIGCLLHERGGLLVWSTLLTTPA
jgi:hypothetical protein